VCLTPILVPADELFRGEADRDHHKLQVEPILLEPQKQIRTQDDWQRPEPERIRVASRPGEQHVERVREEQLRDDQIRRFVHGPPIPTPIQEDRRVGTCLNVVLRSQHNLEVQCAVVAKGRNEQDAVPREQDGGCSDN
jgi:hypothetical protein